jgi:pimeloyl-ACP methyl ester carboxylesterase
MSELYTPKPRLLSELGAVGDIARLPVFWAGLRRLPRGSSTVLVLPGYMTTDASTWVLRRALSGLGHTVHGWGLGRNRGHVARLVAQLTPVVTRLAQAGPIHLVGWSLGGFIARELARDLPQHVVQVITLGTPVVGGPKYTAAAPGYIKKGFDVDALAARTAARAAERPLEVPVYALYSPRDTIVCPAACIDPHPGQTVHVEMQCSHAGFGFHGPALAWVARQLSEGETHAI